VTRSGKSAMAELANRGAEVMGCINVN